MPKCPPRGGVRLQEVSVSGSFWLQIIYTQIFVLEHYLVLQYLLPFRERSCQRTKSEPSGRILFIQLRKILTFCCIACFLCNLKTVEIDQSRLREYEQNISSCVAPKQLRYLRNFFSKYFNNLRSRSKCLSKRILQTLMLMPVFFPILNL